MQTAPYQFAETSVTAPSAVNLNTFMSLSGQTSETGGTLSSQRANFLFIDATRGKRNP
jgi:hypothetical protein